MRPPLADTRISSVWLCARSWTSHRAAPPNAPLAVAFCERRRQPFAGVRRASDVPEHLPGQLLEERSGHTLARELQGEGEGRWRHNAAILQ